MAIIIEDKEKQQELIKMIITRFEFAKQQRYQYEKKWKENIDLYKRELPKRLTGYANIFIPKIFEIIDALTARIYSAVFSTSPFLAFIPRTQEDVPKAQVVQKVINYQLEQNDFRQKSKEWFREALIYGISIRKITSYFEKKEFINEKGEKEEGFIFMYPKFEYISPVNFFIDPTASKIEEAEWIIDRRLKPIQDVRKLAEEGIYEGIDEIPEDERAPEEVTLLTPSIIREPYEKKWEVMECWCNWKIDEKIEPIVATIINRKHLVRLERNPYIGIKYPYVAISIHPLPNQFYGEGIIQLVILLQHALNDIFNQMINILNLQINPHKIVNRLADVDLDSLVLVRPGAITEATYTGGVSQAVDYLRPDFSGFTVASAMIKMIIEMMENITGATSPVLGRPLPKRITATEFSALITEANVRIISIIEDVENVLQQLGEIFLKMSQQYISLPLMVRITADVRGTWEFMTVTPEEIKGEFDIKAVGSLTDPASTKIVQQTNLLKLLEVIGAFYPNVDRYEFIKRLAELMDIKDADRFLYSPLSLIAQQVRTMLQQGITPEQILQFILQSEEQLQTLQQPQPLSLFIPPVPIKRRGKKTAGEPGLETMIREIARRRRPGG